MDRTPEKTFGEQIRSLNVDFNFLLLGDYGAMAKIFNYEFFKDFSEYGKTLLVDTPVSSISERPEYQTLVSENRSYPLRDERLKALKLNKVTKNPRLLTCAKLAAKLNL